MRTGQTAMPAIEGDRIVTLSRIGNALLLGGGLALAALLGYVLWIDPLRNGSDGRLPGTVEVAVVVPLRDDWHSFRQGILACSRDGLVRMVRETPSAVTVATRGSDRPIRFGWVPARGAIETENRVGELVRGPAPPAAFVGSANTALTVALARGIEANSPGSSGPVLLVPWATATLSRPGDALPLLRIVPDRTFRFCPNNDRLAELVVGCVLEQEPAGPPSGVLVVEDPADPYSVDLAGAFGRAIRQAAPGVELTRKAETLASPGLVETPGPGDERCAARLWERVKQAPDGRATWLVLPLQGAPIRRILTALQRQAPPGATPPLRVLCGDGIGATSMRDFAPRIQSFSVWCPSWDGLTGVEGRAEMPGAALVPAEVVAALAAAVDRASPGPDGLRDALAALDLKAGDPLTLGRSLAFTPEGERRSADLGHVLAVLPGTGRVAAYSKRDDGAWSGPVELPALPLLAQP
jgi:hypothetical protein